MQENISSEITTPGFPWRYKAAYCANTFERLVTIKFSNCSYILKNIYCPKTKLHY